MADQILITEQVTVLEIDDSTVEVIEIAQQGPAGTPGAQGPVGPQGPKGDTGSPATNLVSSVAGRTGAVTLSRSDVGLETVDNTSDADKPVSTAAKTALNLKADDASVLHKSGDESVAGVKTFATSPVVPTPTTGGQAAPKSYVDSAASSVNNFSGSTPATNTSLDTLTNPGVYRITWGATVAQGAPFESFYGTVEVLPRAGGAMTQIAYKHNALSADSRRFYQRTQTGAGWGAWSVFAAQRVDQTAGRAIYVWDDLNGQEQIVYGDSGFRSITGLASNGWTIAICTLRRVGSVVTFGVFGANPANATSDTILTIPPGFRPSSSYGGNTSHLAWTGSGVVTPVQFTTSAAMTARRDVGSIGQGAISLMTWTTTDPWPTTLPGTASGSIPSV